MNSYEMKLHDQYLEPEYPKSYGTDWNGNDIHEGRRVLRHRRRISKSRRRGRIFKFSIFQTNSGGMIGNEITRKIISNSNETKSA